MTLNITLYFWGLIVIKVRKNFEKSDLKGGEISSSPTLGKDGKKGSGCGVPHLSVYGMTHPMLKAEPLGTTCKALLPKTVYILERSTVIPL